MEKCKESGPIQPKHLRESVRKLKRKGLVPNTRYQKRLFHRYNLIVANYAPLLLDDRQS